jgi:hypothetical protein
MGLFYSRRLYSAAIALLGIHSNIFLSNLMIHNHRKYLFMPCKLHVMDGEEKLGPGTFVSS